MTAGKNRSDRVLCSVSRASAGLTTEYLIVSSKPPTGYYVDGVTECSVSRASAGFTEYLIVSNQSSFALIVCHHPILETHLVIHAHQTTIPRSSTHRKYQSTIQHSSNFNFLRGHHLPPIDYARPRRQQSPISTIHLALFADPFLIWR